MFMRAQSTGQGHIWHFPLYLAFFVHRATDIGHPAANKNLYFYCRTIEHLEALILLKSLSCPKRPLSNAELRESSAYPG
jgi:hypothetical protein